jgi:hypothetical protein
MRKKTRTRDSQNVAILEAMGDISLLGIVAGVLFSFRLAAALSSPPDEAFLRCHWHDF